MTIEIIYPFALALMSLLFLWTLPNGLPNVIFITLTTILLGVGSLLVYSGVSIWWALGTFIAACAMLAVGVWRADAAGSIESRWALVGLSSIPTWAIVCSITGLVRLLS